MTEQIVVHVRATSGNRFDLRRSGPVTSATTERRGLSTAEAAEAIRALPSSDEIQFLNDGPGPVDLVALVNAALQRRGRDARGSRSARGASTPRSYMLLCQRTDGLYDVEVEPAGGEPRFAVSALSAEAVVDRYLARGSYKFSCRDVRGRLAIEQPPDDIARALAASGRRYGREACCDRCGDTGVADSGPCPWCSVATPRDERPVAMAAS